METPTDNTYPTSNTAEAAWLVSQGFELLNSERNSEGSVVFYFLDNTKALKEAVKAFQTGKAKGNIVTFFGKYKEMLRKVFMETKL